MRNGWMAALLILSVLALPAAVEAVADQDGGRGCSVRCWNGTSCSASGPGPCDCHCRGFLGLGGAFCTCAGMQIANPCGD